MAAALFVWAHSGCERAASVARQPDCAPHGPACANPCDPRGIASVHLNEAPARPISATDVPVAVTITTAWAQGSPARRDFDAWVEEASTGIERVFAQCGLRPNLLRAELARVPSRLLHVTANTPESWAGLAPAGKNSERFNYDLHERLTPEVRELFSYARRGLPDRALVVVVADQIDYFAAKQATRAGGLSFPPNVYHHADDFPLRNGVLLSGTYVGCGSLPKAPMTRVIAHELGHMLLNQAHHEEDPRNLMGTVSGPELRPEQCAKIRANLQTLYGEKPFADPGPPAE